MVSHLYYISISLILYLSFIPFFSQNELRKDEEVIEGEEMGREK